jgi:hypothetical protein
VVAEGNWAHGKAGDETMANRITWTRNTGTGRSGWDGDVGGRRLFSIEKSIVRNGGWVLRTRLPFGLVDDKATQPDEAELKDYAERVLIRFVRSLGADWSK